MNGDSRLGTFASKTVFRRPEKRGSANRRWNATRRHQGRRALSLACAAFSRDHAGLLQRFSARTRRVGASIDE